MRQNSEPGANSETLHGFAAEALAQPRNRDSS